MNLSLSLKSDYLWTGREVRTRPVTLGGYMIDHLIRKRVVRVKENQWDSVDVGGYTSYTIHTTYMAKPKNRHSYRQRVVETDVNP